MHMVSLFGLLLSVSLLSAPHLFSNTRPPEAAATPYRIGQTVDSSFTATNTTSVNIGFLTIHLANQTNAYINITGSGTYGATLSDAPAGCEINGQSFYEGVAKRINIDAHTSVRVIWTSSFVVFDQDEIH